MGAARAWKKKRREKEKIARIKSEFIGDRGRSPPPFRKEDPFLTHNDEKEPITFLDDGLRPEARRGEARRVRNAHLRISPGYY